MKPGDNVNVTPAAGAPFSGKIASLSADQLTLLVGTEVRTLREADVDVIRHRRNDSLANGAAWGLGIGAAASFVTCGRCHLGTGLALAGVYGGIGAGIGVGIDALIRGRVAVFRRRDSTGRVVVSPQLAPSHQAVNVTVRF